MRRTCLMQTVSFRRLSARVLQPIVAQVIMKNKSGLIPAVTMALVLASAAVSHLAAAENTFTWSGAGGDGNWGTSANWSTAGGRVVPTVNLQGFCNFPGSTRLNNTNNFTVGAGAHQMYFKSGAGAFNRSEEHTSELQSPDHLVCRLLLEKKKKKMYWSPIIRAPPITFTLCTLSTPTRTVY